LAAWKQNDKTRYSGFSKVKDIFFDAAEDMEKEETERAWKNMKSILRGMLDYVRGVEGVIGANGSLNHADAKPDYEFLTSSAEEVRKIFAKYI